MYGYAYRYNSGLVLGEGTPPVPPFANNWSLDFDGIDDYVDTGIPNLSGTDFTISYWFKTTATFANFTYYVPFSAVSNYGFVGAYLYNRPTELVVICKNSSGAIPRGTTNLKDGNWHHIASTYNETTKNFKTYVDGSLELDETIFSYAIFNQPLLLGGKSSSLNLINCFIDEPAYWNTELTSANITDIYNSGTPTDLTDLSPIAWYRNGDNGNWKSPQWIIPNNENFLANKVSNYSFDFDAIDDYIDLSNADDLNFTNDFTLSAWVKTSAIGANQFVIDKSTSASVGNGYSLRILNTGKVRFWSYAASGLVDSATTLSADTWYHIAATHDRSGAINKIYINGALDVSGASGTFNPTINNLRIGTSAVLGNPFGGKIDSVSFYDSELSASDILTIYNSGTPTTISGAIAHYKMGEEANFTSNWLVDNSALDNYSKRSFDFDGIDDYVSTNSKIIGSDITLSGWVNFNGSYSNFSAHFPLSITPSNTSVGNETLGRFYKNGSTLQIAIQCNDNTGTNFSTYYVDNTTLEGAGWQHICLTYNVTTKHIYAYLNGVAQNWVKIFGASTPVPFLTAVSTRLYESDLTIGRVEPATSTGSFLGLVDEVSTYNRILTQAEITALYNSGTPTTLPSGAVAHWRMGEDATFNGTNWTVPDNVGTNNGTSNAMDVDDLVGEAPNYSGGGISSGMTIEDRVGEAPNSDNNALSFNMDLIDRTTDVPT